MNSTCREEKPPVSKSPRSVADSAGWKSALVDLSPDLLAVADPERRILFWSRGAESMTGWSAEEAAGMDFFELLRVSGRTDLADAFGRVVAGGEWEGDFGMVRRDQSRRTLLGRWRSLREAGTAKGSVLLVNCDVTDFKPAGADSRRAQRMDNIGALACGIAHDLNNVLSPIMICSDVLASASRGPDESEMVELIRSSALRGSRIVRQVSLFARGDDGERVPVEASHIVSEAAQLLRATLPKNLTFRSSATPDAGFVLGDPAELQQVVLTLCIHARDAMPDGGNLTLAAERVMADELFAAMAPGAKGAAYVVLSVTDSGEGIPAEERKRIFDAQIPSMGAGSRLATVRSIIESHGGFVRCESVVGQGTVFYACLPALADDEPADVAGRQEARGSGELLLVVEDEAAIANLCGKVLEGQGYRVLIAADGVEALELFARNRGEIRAVIGDVCMPRMDGVGLVRAIRETEPHVPILIATGATEGPLLRQVEALPAVSVIRKPFTRRLLLAAVQRCLATPGDAAVR
ncbi:MAG: response regulator [Chthoniobacteraceae bacterium]